MRLFILACLTLILSANPSAPPRILELDASEAGGFPEDVEKLVQDIHTSKDPHLVAEKYRLLFKTVGADGLRMLQTHPRDEIAIQAAWEEVRLSVPENKPARAVSPDRHKLDRYVGFLEGRGRLNVPRWWSESLLGCMAHRRDNIFPGPSMTPYHKLGLDFASGPEDTTLKMEGENAVLRIGKESTPIPIDLLEKTDDGKVYCSVSASMTPSRCYVAVHGDVGYPYKLSCIDRATGKVLWKSDVFATWWGGASGQHHMALTVTEQDNRIIVFGSASTGLHAEAFRSEDGTNLFRFSTSY